MRWIQAAICAASRETVYRQSGKGAPVLLLLAAADQAPEDLLHALARRARVVIVPVAAPENDAGDPGWLSDFLDALALDEAAVIAAPGCRHFARSFTARYPCRVSRLIVIAGPVALRSEPDQPIAEGELTRTAVHVLDHLGRTAPEIEEVVLAALDDSAAPRAPF